MRTTLLASSLVLGSIGGCIGVTDPFLDPPNVCGAAGDAYSIDTNGSVAYEPGVDAGWYPTYLGGGQWHVEWTCDSKVSAYGCNFTGTIVAETPAGGPNASCYQCEAADALSVADAGGGEMAIQVDTITTTAVDGVDFTTTPGSTVTFDVRVDGVYHPELVYLDSGGGAASPTCVPFTLTPTTP